MLQLQPDTKKSRPLLASMVAVLGTIVIPGRLSLGTMSLDAIEKKQSLQQHVTLGISSTCGDIIADELRRSYVEYGEVPASVLRFLEMASRH
jgi:hypothetical protein